MALALVNLTYAYISKERKYVAKNALNLQFVSPESDGKKIVHK